MKTPLLRAWILGGLILFMDQWTKGLVVAHLELGEQREWVEGFFRLVYWGNTGAAGRTSVAPVDKTKKTLHPFPLLTQF